MIKIRIIGPEDIGFPHVAMSVDSPYSPDVAHDLKNLAVRTYIDLFGGDLYTEVTEGESGEIPGVDLSSTTDGDA